METDVNYYTTVLKTHQMNIYHNSLYYIKQMTWNYAPLMVYNDRARERNIKC